MYGTDTVKSGPDRVPFFALYDDGDGMRIISDAKNRTQVVVAAFMKLHLRRVLEGLEYIEEPDPAQKTLEEEPYGFMDPTDFGVPAELVKGKVRP